MGRVPLVRTSERLMFKRCRWAWDRDFNDLLRPTRTAPPLRFGTLVHASLEAYYKPGTKRGPHPAKTFKRLFDLDYEEQGHLGFRDEDGKWADAGEMGIDLLESYIEEYGADKRYEVIATEQPFTRPIFEGKRKVALYTGIMDGIWRDLDDGTLFIVDHKTAATINTTYLALDEQAGAYWTFGQDWIRAKGLLPDGEPLAGMLYNFLRKSTSDPRPRNKDGHYLNQPTKDVLLAEYKRLGRSLPAPGTGSGKKGAVLTADLVADLGPTCLQLGEVSANQPPARFHRERVYRDEPDREAVRARVLEELREMRLVRAGKLTAYKNPGAMNCPMCGYRDVCELHETGHDWQEMMKQTMETWKPYAAHEIRDGEQR